MDKVAETEQELLLSLTEKRGFGKPFLHIAKGRPDDGLYQYQLDENGELPKFDTLNSPSIRRDASMHDIQRRLALGIPIVYMDTEASISPERIAAMQRMLDEMQAKSTERVVHVAKPSVSNWMTDSFLDMTLPAPEKALAGDPGMAVEPEPREWKCVRGHWQWVTTKSSKHKLGKTVKRKHRHRKGK